MVYISKLNKNIWPHYIPPLEDELFSSWFCRLSNEHKVKNETFLNNFFGRQLPFWNRDIDMSANNDVVNTILAHTPLTLKELESLFLKSYESFAFEKSNPNGITDTLLPLGINHRKRKRYGLLCCPLCLSKPTPYFRKKWRLATSILCCECNCYLIESCPSCNNPISFHRSNFNSNKNSSTSNNLPLNICECGSNISLFPSVIKPTQLEYEYQSFIDQTILNGFNTHSQYSFTYLKILILVTFKLVKSRKNDRFKKTFNNFYPGLVDEISEPFFNWNLQQRKQHLPISYNLLKNYPADITELLIKGNVIRTEFGQVPYWFEKVLVFR